MHPLFSISADDIQSLNDRQARELIARLCRAEIRAAGGSEASVTWGGDQRAADGGIDVRVESNLDLSTDGYIPQSVTCFQVKAEPFPPSKITEEMMPSGTIRQSIEELAQSGGAYIIVSTQDRTSDHWLKERLSAIKNCITKAGLNDTFTTNFYDSRRIADWIEQHPGVLVWTRTQVGKPLVGWQSYGPWGFRESDVHSEYLFDDTVRVFAPDNEKSISTIDALDRVRGDLQKRPCSIRIIGLSGVGKTRLVQAIFDERIQTSNSLPLSENVLYTDLSDHPSPQPNALVQGLLTEGAETTVVVDNCSPDVHERLTTIIKGAKSRLGLITLEYDVRDDLQKGLSATA